MGAGGSHPQATMMPDPWATYKCPSASQAMITSPLPASQSFSNFSGKSRKGRPRSNTRAQDNTAVLEETLRLFVEAIGKEGDSRLAARERVKMGEEDSSTRRRTEWERIFDRSPFLKTAS